MLNHWVLTFPKFHKNKSLIAFVNALETTNPQTNCYFCFVKTSGVIKKNKHCNEYPHFDLVMRPVLHSNQIPIPKFKMFLKILLCILRSQTPVFTAAYLNVKTIRKN